MDDDDLHFGTFVWRMPTDLSSSSFLASKLNRNKEFDDNDDDDAGFNETVQAAVEDEDFTDFGDFREATNEIDASSFKNNECWPRDPLNTEWQILKLTSGQSKTKIGIYVGDLLGPLWARNVPSEIMTDKGIRQMEGFNQVLATSESRALYHTLFQVDPSITQSADWIRSRIRRRYLSSLGIPVNLDEVLHHTMGKPLPALRVTMRPSSAPPGSEKALPASSRPQSTKRSFQYGTLFEIPSSLHLVTESEQLDEHALSLMLDLTPDSLGLLSVTTLHTHLRSIRDLMEMTSSALAHLLQARDSLQQDAEAYNGLIAELVNEAHKAKVSGKSRIGGNKV